jgi:tRNA G18 (ribose-2'-O)-methylase SpoU
MKNVKDAWKDLPDEEIMELRDTVPLVVVTENTGDFNKASILRTAEIFGATEFVIIGKKAWDRRGAVGAHHRIKMSHYATWDDFFEQSQCKFYNLTALEQDERSVPLDRLRWAPMTMLLIGEEGNGLPQEVIDRCDKVVEINQYGAGRSLNVAAAAAIAIYDYRKFTTQPRVGVIP